MLFQVLHYSLLLKLSGYVNLIAKYWMKKKTFNQGKRSLWIFSWIIRFGILLDFPRKIQIYTSFSFTTHDNPTGGWDDKRDISHSKGHHQRKANLFPECGIADAYQMQKKSFQDSFDLLLSQIYYLVLGSGFNQEMECKVVLAKLTNRRDKKFAQGLALVNWIDHIKRMFCRGS